MVDEFSDASSVSLPRARVAFVTPRYGSHVVGGSEAMMAEAARGLAGLGHEVEVLTTTTEDHYRWSNDHPVGSFEDAGLTVRRFRIVHTRRRVYGAQLEARVQRRESLSLAEEIAWVNARFAVPDLYLYLTARAQRYDALVFSPYLFWSTVYGAAVAPERSIVMPCLHDEPYAALSIVARTLESVAVTWFLSEPEHQLAHRLAPGLSPEHVVVGGAVEEPTSYDPAGFRARHGLARPFVLYAGRREEGKGWRQLLSDFAYAVSRQDMPFDLVTFGAGEANVPAGLRQRVIDLGFLDSAEVPSAFAAAEAVLQPSANESFSRTLMEAWLAQTPVIATARGEVVTWHCERSGGGLTYTDAAEFARCLSFVASAPKAAAGLAERGRRYVLEHYSWPRVLDKMQTSIDALRARLP